jgi:hypothetical protein
MPTTELWLQGGPAQVEYDAATNVLTIRFKGGEAYQFTGVSQQLYASLLAAPSAGRYFNAYIKPLGGERIE